MYNTYSEYFNDPQLVSALMGTSRSLDDATHRANEYSKLFSRTDDYVSEKNLLEKTFSGYAETPLLSTQYFDATVASYVSSFAGFMSVERDFEHPNGLFYWYDVLGVTDMRTVIPNLGPDNYADIQTTGGFTTEVTPSANPSVKDYQVITGRKIIPGSVRVKLVENTDSYELVDNGRGNLMSIANKLTASSINYLNGTITFTLVTNPTEVITVLGKEDVTGTPCNTNGASNAHANDKRFLAKMQQLYLATVPDTLMAETNIASIAASKKDLNVDIATFMFTKLRELYTKLINRTLVRTLEDSYTGLTMGTDTDGFSMTETALNGKFSEWRSRSDMFDSYLVDVESALAEKAVKGVNITAYVAGSRACNQFQKASQIGKFEKNTKMTYINDLLGWYDGIPVLRSTDIVEPVVNSKKRAVFYAIHKTADGAMAPLARGIYMPITDTPTVGNYNNPTQMVSGIWYQEGVRSMANELVQRVEFEIG